ncbi:MAG: PEPxxWA-CTERM sorting domain-containing protein, partial [Caldimonas sp.]
ITVTAHLDGSSAFHDPGYAEFSQAMDLYLGGASFSEIGGANNFTSYYGINGASGYVPPSGWQSYSFSNQTPQGFDFSGVLRVGDLERDVFHLGLNLDCSCATCDFMHTGSIGLSLPEGVSYTSDSGVFLTAGSLPVSPVPEPETWALMLAGLGIVGHFTRRRKETRARG